MDRHLGRPVYFVLVALFFAAVFVLLLNTNMHKELNHDEHMYVAAGDLLGRGLLVPYRDYPYFQMPNLALVYAVIFQVTDHLLLAARLFNTLCAFAALGVIFYSAASLLRGAGYAVRFLVGAGGTLLLMSNPLFLYTSGLAWNHDLPVLLALLAASLHIHGIGQIRAVRWLAASGVLVGLAVGTRLSFAPAMFPFAGAVFFMPGVASLRRKLNLLGVFSQGLLVAILPTVVMAALAPARFLFDNLGYHQANVAYWQQLGYTRAMTLPGKLDYLKDVAAEPGNLLLLLAFVLFTALAIRVLRARPIERSRLVFVTLLLPFLLIGALAPTPTWYQYFYALVPFLILGIVYGVAALYSDGVMGKWSLALFGLAVLASCWHALPTYTKLNRSLAVDGWVPIAAHRAGIEIKRTVGEGGVLTLAPLFPLEGGANIYEELATGPFAWRMAGQLSGEQRKELDVISGDDLGGLLQANPPGGILVGPEPGLEDALVQYAQAHGYRPLALPSGATLWLLPR